ncbi:glycosyltransferase family 2 protein [Parabacteroides distasonis]|nr:glycosyltransferase family 2 protein [Parabacteroides distasonis]
MKIFVIIPTYKPQAYLWECLDSMVAQTFPKEEFEVILVLNGCTEPYKSDIERYIAA